ncbi:DUF4307 domain-containing protein [Cellulomonas sp. KRMCY2]|uniref:DUF4307 domain-containing protein n=1 Tax=Cellulomonas sp. KRMCY2 TaxID=1304865 RepID=UPI00045E68AC|nr:DUF4307 domain-containing protein [Cellulomonas sp. KRMCY2]
MSAPTPTSPPAGRYGPEPDAAVRRRRVVLLWALGAGGLALAVWLGIGVGDTPVAWQDVGFTLHGAERVEVDFDVIRTDPAVPARCTLQALNEQYAQVGVLTVDVPPGTERVVRLSSTVATSEAAVTGIVESCWAAVD